MPDEQDPNEGGKRFVISRKRAREAEQYARDARNAEPADDGQRFHDYGPVKDEIKAMYDEVRDADRAYAMDKRNAREHDAPPSAAGRGHDPNPPHLQEQANTVHPGYIITVWLSCPHTGRNLGRMQLLAKDHLSFMQALKTAGPTDALWGPVPGQSMPFGFRKNMLERFTITDLGEVAENARRQAEAQAKARSEAGSEARAKPEEAQAPGPDVEARPGQPDARQGEGTGTAPGTQQGPAV